MIIMILIRNSLDELNLPPPPYVIITEEEYDALKNNCNISNK